MLWVLGYVGLPLMLRYAEAGYAVLGFDVDSTKVRTFRVVGATLNIYRRLASQLRNCPQQRTLHERRKADALIICVPTPLNRYREPDLSFVIGTVESLLPALRPGQVIALESTTYPGTTEEELLPRIEQGGLSVGTDVYLVYSPEREDPGNAQFETRTIPKVVGGHTSACSRGGQGTLRYRHRRSGAC